MYNSAGEHIATSSVVQSVEKAKTIFFRFIFERLKGNFVCVCVCWLLLYECVERSTCSIGGSISLTVCEDASRRNTTEAHINVQIWFIPI